MKKIITFSWIAYRTSCTLISCNIVTARFQRIGKVMFSVWSSVHSLSGVHPPVSGPCPFREREYPLVLSLVLSHVLYRGYPLVLSQVLSGGGGQDRGTAPPPPTLPTDRRVSAAMPRAVSLLRSRGRTFLFGLFFSSTCSSSSGEEGCRAGGGTFLPGPSHCSRALLPGPARRGLLLACSFPPGGDLFPTWSFPPGGGGSPCEKQTRLKTIPSLVLHMWSVMSPAQAQMQREAK